MGSKGLGKGKKLGSVYLDEELKSTLVLLAQTYKVSFSDLIQRLGEEAVEKWSVPGMLPRERPGGGMMSEKKT